jgi:predicted phosphodiesterase
VTKKCSRCGRLVETKGFKTCDTCREESREYRNQHREHEQERQIEWQRLSRKKKREARYLEGIYDKYTHDELKAISKGKGVYEFTVTPPKVNIDHTGEEIRFGFFTDSHMGSIYYHEAFLDDFIKTCKEKKAQFCVAAGDITHGMDSRKYNLLYELKHIGYAAQKEYAEEQLSKIPFRTYLVSGNHDRWYESVGANIVKDICEMVPKTEYIGRDEGDIEVEGISIRVFHGEDFSSYATSYRAQKLIESFTGGTKPNVLLLGHAHKQGYFFERNIHAVSGGALSTQSKWMRSKRMANHAGYHFITMRVDDEGVAEFTLTFRPFYV